MALVTPRKRAAARSSSYCRAKLVPMLAEAQSDLIPGHWWQLATAKLFMAVFVIAFSMMAAAWRDAPDPKLRGLE